MVFAVKGSLNDINNDNVYQIFWTFECHKSLIEHQKCRHRSKGDMQMEE
jgi:hypothetical protein